ncbi:hypothetical protein [Actinomadura sp. WMMA1423]|uniref:hypothetical protein n=1 Tax=Actinomadura sp. WMMA1423 TaxID=2591108 RepID=UPI0011463B80|nr:hypothetical protein [Actinomadura sp. WMMA1423]
MGILLAGQGIAVDNPADNVGRLLSMGNMKNPEFPGLAENVTASVRAVLGPDTEVGIKIPHLIFSQRDGRRYDPHFQAPLVEVLINGPGPAPVLPLVGTLTFPRLEGRLGQILDQVYDRSREVFGPDARLRIHHLLPTAVEVDGWRDLRDVKRELDDVIKAAKANNLRAMDHLGEVLEATNVTVEVAR